LVLAAEILALRHQLLVLKRARPARLPLSYWDRALWAFVLRRWTGWKDSLVLVKPETVIAWHRLAFRLFLRIPLIVSAGSGIVSAHSGDREHAVGAKRRYVIAVNRSSSLVL